MTDLAAEYQVNRKTLWRRLDALERAEAERAQRSGAARAGDKQSRPSARTTATPSGPAEHPPEIRVDQKERRDPPPPADKQPDAARPLRSPQPPTTRLDAGGVPIFPDTPEGRAERLAYYDARKLNHPSHSLLDYNDAKRGRETPAERQARQRRDSGRPRY